jgi:molybdenum cofactor synthesis domain-containing protein
MTKVQEYLAAVLTISDKGSRGERVDKSGEVIKNILSANGYKVGLYKIIPDEKEVIIENLTFLSDEQNIPLIITTGGTGFSIRDVTPEATKEIITKEVPGIAEAIRSYSLTITKRAMLSRGVSGIRNKSLIINLPGSPKAVDESLSYIIETLKHGLDILHAKDSECGLSRV